MSGIVGLYQADSDREPRFEVRHMIGMLAHRGSSAVGAWADRGIGLAHCALHLSRRSANDPAPLAAEDGSCVLVADARIDNRSELAERLGWGGSAAVVGDHALILGAYLKWGERCAEHLLGDFSFALWDGRRRRLFCARDHLGIRPFYYCASGGTFAFASEIKALLRLEEVPRRPNASQVADFLLQATADKQATFYEGIHRLPPAHALLVSREGIRLQPYWSPDPDREIRLASDEAYADAYREHFVSAVRACMDDAPSVGCLLSGGLDSSSIAAVAYGMAREDSEEPLHTFSCVFDELPQCDERPYIQAVVEKGRARVHPHFIHADRKSIFDDLDRMLFHVEQPFFTPNLFLTWQAWQAAADVGVPRLLHGFLGDNVVSDGARLLTEHFLALRWFTLAREMRAVARLQGAGTRLYHRILRQYVVAPLVPPRLRRGDSVLVQRLVARHAFNRFVNADFARAIGWSERLTRAAQEALSVPHTIREGHRAELDSGVLPGALEIENKAVAAFGFEQRYPFADRRLIEFCLATPSVQRFRDGLSRHLPRRAMRDILPDHVRMRPTKANLHPVFRHALMTLGRPDLDAIMFDRLPIASDYLDVSALRAAYREAVQHLSRAGRPGQAILPFWQVALLVRWLERERTPPPARGTGALDGLERTWIEPSIPHL